MSNARIAAVTLSVAIGCSWPVWAAAPEPYHVTPDLVAAATKEGTVIYYTSTDIQVAEKLGAAFEAK